MEIIGKIVMGTLLVVFLISLVKEVLGLIRDMGEAIVEGITWIKNKLEDR